MSFATLAHERYSCRAFDPDLPVAADELAALLDVVRAAPTAKNLQPFHAWVFQDPEDLEKIRSCTPCHYGAPLLVLFGADEGQAFVRSDDGLNFAQVDAAIVATHYMLAAADLGLDTCWVGLIDVARVHELFPQTAGHTLVGLFPTGHALEGKGGPSERHTLRKPLDEIVSQ